MYKTGAESDVATFLPFTNNDPFPSPATIVVGFPSPLSNVNSSLILAFPVSTSLAVTFVNVGDFLNPISIFPLVTLVATLSDV